MLKETESISPPEYGIAISNATRLYHREFIQAFDQQLGGSMIRTQYATHDNGMPLWLTGSANRVLHLVWFSGDNYRSAGAEIDYLGNALTASPDRSGANTNELVVMIPFADLRGHKRTTKVIPETAGRKAIVKAEGVTNIALARKLKHVAGAQVVVSVDIHNQWETGNQFLAEELPILNLTTNQVFVDYLLANKNKYLAEELPTVVGSTDIGSLASAYDLAERLGLPLNSGNRLPLAINLKTRFGHDLHQTLVDNGISIEGTRVIVKDDMISSGSTTVSTIEGLLSEGAAEVIFYAPHAVFVKDYYKKLASVLSDPRVKIITTNSIPTVREGGKTVPAPYGTTPDGLRNSVEILEIQDWLAQKASTILKAETIDEATALISNEVIPHTNPYKLLSELTGQTYYPPEPEGVYMEGGIIYSLAS